MRTTNYCLLGVAAVCAIALVAATHGPEPSHKPFTRYGWQFYLGGEDYACNLARSDILSTPAWSPTEPLPLSIGKAVEIARTQLRGLVEDEKAWYTADIMLTCLGRTPPENLYQSWYYGIRFRPTTRPTPTNGPVRLEDVVICVDFLGRTGTVSRVGTRAVVPPWEAR